ncbi:MAG: ABC transporter ATP-binding protein [Planctomycetes bacterium]|nr:ABC transporter ATP-binding protein [Planctomycetota bacterium]
MIQACGLIKDYPTAARPNGGGLWSRFFSPSGMRRALDGLSFEARPGEIFGLLGPNGAGKTTVIKILCTLLTPDGGTACVNGFDILKQPMKVKRSLGVLLDSPERGFVFKLTGRDNLEFFASIHGFAPREARRRTSELLTLLGLEASAGVEMQKYSTGMKQKLALARALLSDPPVMILDEPTNGLDPQSAADLRSFIHERVRGGQKTVLMTTHNMDEAERLCDRVAIISAGRLVALDAPARLKERMNRSQRVEIQVASPPSGLLDDLRSLPGVARVEATPDPGANGLRTIVVWADPRAELTGRLVQAVLKHTDALHSISRRTPTFEEVFIHLLESRGSPPP